MPAPRLSMRKIIEVLRLKWAQGLSNRQIAGACRIGRPTVAEYLRRANEAGLRWPLPPELDEAALERQLFPPPPSLPPPPPAFALCCPRTQRPRRCYGCSSCRWWHGRHGWRYARNDVNRFTPKRLESHDSNIKAPRKRGFFCLISQAFLDITFHRFFFKRGTFIM